MTLSLDRLTQLTDPAFIQAQIDEALARYQADRFVEYVRYIPQGQDHRTAAPDATHLLSLTDAQATEGIYLAIKAKAPYAWLADMVLSRV